MIEILTDEILILVLTSSFVLQVEKLISIILDSLNKDPRETASLKQNCKYFKVFLYP